MGRDGSSSESWNTNPTEVARRRERSRSGRVEASTSPRRTTPEVGVSMSPSTYRRVDLPRPEGPVRAVTAPGVNAWVRPSNSSSAARV